MMRTRICPACGGTMRFVRGSDRTTRTAIYYEMQCEHCLLKLDGCKPRRMKRK